VEESRRVNCVETVAEGNKGGALREEHEDTVETFEEVGVFLGLQEL
jgi:hypothetical protein